MELLTLPWHLANWWWNLMLSPGNGVWFLHLGIAAIAAVCCLLRCGAMLAHREWAEAGASLFFILSWLAVPVPAMFLTLLVLVLLCPGIWLAPFISAGLLYGLWDKRQRQQPEETKTRPRYVKPKDPDIVEAENIVEKVCRLEA